MFKLFFMVVSVLVVMANDISTKYMTANNCKGCHKWVVDGWKTSWHSHSHYTKDPLYKATLEYMSKKTLMPLNAIELKCAQCHNPRITIKKMGLGEIFASGFGMEAKEIKKAVNAPYVKDGINCIVCHNIDKIKESKNPDERGYKSIIWGPNNVMVGPYDNAHSPYHKTKQGEHFLHPNKLCFLCHYNGKNSYGMYVYETGMEYEKSGTKKTCVDCHMGKTRKQRVATIKVDGKLPPIRTVRDHLFMGARNGDILDGALDISTKRTGKKIVVKIKNITPHRVPTGFASRAIVVEADFDKSSKKVELTTKFVDENGKETIPYLAKKKVKDERFMPNDSKKIVFDIPKGSKKVVIKVYYKLVNDFVQKSLNIKNPIFTKEYIFYEEKFNL